MVTKCAHCDEQAVTARVAYTGSPADFRDHREKLTSIPLCSICARIWDRADTDSFDED